MTSLHQLQDVKHPVYAREIHNAKNIHDIHSMYTKKSGSSAHGASFYLVVILGTEGKLSGVEEEAKRSGHISALRIVRGAATGAKVGQQHLHIRHSELITGGAGKLELRSRRIVGEFKFQCTTLLLASVLAMHRRKRMVSPGKKSKKELNDLPQS